MGDVLIDYSQHTRDAGLITNQQDHAGLTAIQHTTNARFSFFRQTL